jgi:hypothetical protein
LEQLLAIFKGDYDTLRDLERKSRHVFYVGFGLSGFGLILSALIAFIGLPMLVLGIAVLFVAMLWMSKLQKEPSRAIYCPYCASKNDVFNSRKEFSCDICTRRVAVSPSGEPIPIEPIDDED